MIRLISKGTSKKTMDWLSKSKSGRIYGDLSAYGQMGVDALRSATPFDTGKTATAWSYEIEQGRRGLTIAWTNSNVNQGARIALLIQFGHGTGTGGYISGTDYINPAIKPVFDKIAEEVWKKVTNG